MIIVLIVALWVLAWFFIKRDETSYALIVAIMQLAIIVILAIMEQDSPLWRFLRWVSQ